MARQGGVNSEKRIRKTSKEYKEKFRSKRSNEERDLERSKDKKRKSEKRLNMTEDEMNLMKEKDRIRKQKNKKSERRLNITEEERNLMKEKDRIRKQKKRKEEKEKIKADLRKRIKEGEFAHKGEYYRAKDKRFKACGMYMKNKNDAKQMEWYSRTHKKISRDKRSEEQKEFEKIEQVIMMRKQRQLRDGKAHLLDNLEAKRDMRSLREIGPLKDYMRRKAREMRKYCGNHSGKKVQNIKNSCGKRSQNWSDYSRKERKGKGKKKKNMKEKSRSWTRKVAGNTTIVMESSIGVFQMRMGTICPWQSSIGRMRRSL